MKGRGYAALLCALLMLLCAGAQAETTVVFEDMHYGEEALQMHMNDEENYLIFGGERYSLNDDSFSCQEAFQIHGGKTRAVYEYEIPQNRYSPEDDGAALLLCTVSVDIPYRATLRVGEGNRRSGEYVFSEPITLSDVYEEQIYLQRGADGRPVLTDRVYLYSYEVGGETRRFAATLFIEYEGCQARYAGSAPQGQAAGTDAPSGEEDAGGMNAPLIGLAAAAVLAAAAAGVAAGRKKAKTAGQAQKAQNQAEAPQEEQPFAARAQAMLDQIRTESEGITDPVIAGMIGRLLDVCRRIFETVAEQPGKEPQCRRFMEYYLPTALNMIRVYRTVSGRGVSGEKVDQVRSSTVRGMNMILEACQKLLDNLYSGDVMDITSDVNVLEQMLRRDGFIENELDMFRKKKADGEQSARSEQ